MKPTVVEDSEAEAWLFASAIAVRLKFEVESLNVPLESAAFEQPIETRSAKQVILTKYLGLTLEILLGYLINNFKRNYMRRIPEAFRFRRELDVCLN